MNGDGEVGLYQEVLKGSVASISAQLPRLDRKDCDPNATPPVPGVVGAKEGAARID